MVKLSIVSIAVVMAILMVASATASIYNKQHFDSFLDEYEDKSPFEEDEFYTEVYEEDIISGELYIPEFPEFDTPRDALLYYFGQNPGTEEENKEFIKSVRKFAQRDVNAMLHHNSKTQMLFGLESDEYDQIAEGYRTRLVAFAEALNLEFNQFTMTYEELLDACAVHLVEYYSEDLDIDSFQTLLNELDELYLGRELFIHSYTMLSPDIEDYVLQGVVNLDGMINWTANYLKSNKCSWCKKLAGYIKSKACATAGDYVCKAIATAAAQAIAPLVIKFGCGEPLKLSKFLGNLCQKGINWIQNKTGFTDTKICQSISFGTVKIPAHNGAIFRCSAATISIGTLC